MLNGHNKIVYADVLLLCYTRYAALLWTYNFMSSMTWGNGLINVIKNQIVKTITYITMGTLNIIIFFLEEKIY